MVRSRRFFPLSVLAVAVGPVIFGSPAVQTTAPQLNAAECQVTVSGKEKPARVLAQHVWEATFKRISADPSALVLAGIDAPKALRLAASGNAALARANALRQSLPAEPRAGLPRQVSQDRELVIADSILDARDNELRELSTDEFERLNDYALETASTMQVALPIAGRIVSDDAGKRCEVKVRGQDHPELLPEHEVWRHFFIAWSSMVETTTKQFGRITDQHLVRLARHLRMPAEDVVTFSQIATATAAKDAELRADLARTATEQDQIESRSLQLIMSGRHTILRSIDRDSWRGLMRYVDTVRSNTNSWYSSPVSR